jgi:hypothetical protein
MATVFEQCITEEQHCVVLLLRAKGLNAKDVNKEMFPVYGGKSVAQIGSQLGGKRFADVEDVETEVRKWPRQQSKDC